MPALIPAIWVGVASAAGLTGGYLLAVGIGASLVAGWIQRQLNDKDAPPDPARGMKANTRSANAPLGVLYGELRVGGNTVFVEPTGTDNKDLWMVQNLCEGECEGITQSGGVDRLYLGDKLYTEYGTDFDYTFYSGSATQTYDTDLNTAIAKWDDNKRYTCYLVAKLTFDRDIYQSIPEITMVLQGRKLYDFRDGTTAYSTNPVLALYDFMTSTRYGRGIPSSKIDTTSWTTAANYCDTKGWEINIIIDKQRPVEDVEDDICMLFRGQKVWWDGKYYLRYADLNYESSVMTLEDRHIVQTETGKAAISISQPGTFDTPDALRVLFIDADKDWVDDSILIGDSTGVVKEIRLDGITDREHASNIGTYLLERMQLDRAITGTFRDEAVKLEPHDIVTFNSTALSISDQTMRVIKADVLPNGQIELVLNYESTALYNDNYDIDAEGTYTCDLLDPSAEPPGVANAAAAEETYNYRLRTFTRLNITFDQPADYPWFDRVEVWVSQDDSAWEHLFDATDDFYIANVEEGQDYYVRLRVVSIHGVKQPVTSAVKVHNYITGYTETVPTSLTTLSALVNANSVNLFSTKVADSDVELYEFRLGAAWSSGIFLGALRSPNLSLVGCRPGNHTFFVNTLGNNGLFGATPRSASVSLADPPDGWTVQHTETCSYAESPPGTHSNTEHVTYDADDYLKCSHGGSPVSYSGTYTSPIYNLTASDRYMVYLSADIVVTGTGTTWEDVIPDDSTVSTTWEEINISTKTWIEIFELSAGPQVTIKLLYGDTSPPTNEVERLEILSAIVTGQYFQVEITITDPSAAINALVENFTLKFCQ